MNIKLGTSMNFSLAQHFNPFYATVLFLALENIRIPVVFLNFQVVLKETGVILWVEWC